MQISILIAGFLLGMTHAIEPDHLAAMGTMTTDKPGWRRLAWRGAVWGLGHTLTLLAISMGVILLGWTLSLQTSALLEMMVGFMLVGLAILLFVRLWRLRMHIHVHSHEDGTTHVHFHSHEAGLATHDGHDSHTHRHDHTRQFSLKALGIGMVHGAAGSGALLVLVVAASPSPLIAASYIILFGLGSMLGMAAIGFMASWPLAIFTRWGNGPRLGLDIMMAAIALIVGSTIIYDNIQPFYPVEQGDGMASE